MFFTCLAMVKPKPMTSQNCCVGPAIKDFARVSYLNYQGNTSQLPETIYRWSWLDYPLEISTLAQYLRMKIVLLNFYQSSENVRETRCRLTSLEIYKSCFVLLLLETNPNNLGLDALKRFCMHFFYLSRFPKHWNK